MHVRQLMEILSKADPAAPVRFWIDEDTEVELIEIYDDDCPDDRPDVAEGADCVNIDLDSLPGPDDEDPDEDGINWVPSGWEE